MHVSIEDRDRFLRREIARGLSGRLIVCEMVRLGYFGPDQARERVAREGPAIYTRLSRRFGALFVLGLFLLMAVALAPLPNSPLRTGTAYALSLIGGVVGLAIGWSGVSRYRSWRFDPEGVDAKTARLEGLAREMLASGKGEWAIIHEAGRLSLGDADAARAAAERVWPEVYAKYLARRRSTFKLGLLILGVGLAPIVAYLLSANRRFLSLGDFLGPIFLMIVPIAIGGGLVARGWPRARGKSMELPGTAEVGPVRTGLGWRAEPFEWK